MAAPLTTSPKRGYWPQARVDRRVDAHELAPGLAHALAPIAGRDPHSG